MGGVLNGCSLKSKEKALPSIHELERLAKLENQRTQAILNEPNIMYIEEVIDCPYSVHEQMKFAYKQVKINYKNIQFVAKVKDSMYLRPQLLQEFLKVNQKILGVDGKTNKIPLIFSDPSFDFFTVSSQAWVSFVADNVHRLELVENDYLHDPTRKWMDESMFFTFRELIKTFTLEDKFVGQAELTVNSPQMIVLQPTDFQQTRKIDLTSTIKSDDLVTSIQPELLPERRGQIEL